MPLHLLWFFLNNQHHNGNARLPVTLFQLWFFLNNQRENGNIKLPTTLLQLWFFLHSQGDDMEHGIMKCPRCDGSGKLFPGIPSNSPWYKLSCIRCLGSGNVLIEMLEWMRKGAILQERAFRELKMYHNELERATKIDSSTLYKVMDGLVPYPSSPDPLNRLNQWIRDETQAGRWPPKNWDKRV